MRALLSESKQTQSPCNVKMLYPVSTDVMHLRTLQKDSTLKQFEVAQLANLCPGDVEEAKSLIPRSVCESRPALPKAEEL
jgi:hypothetical protein